MIINGILWFLLWPLLIFASYQLIRFVLKKYEVQLEEISEEDNGE